MKQAEISDRGLVRLLPATYHKPPALRGLVDSDDELDILAEIEGLTSGRLLAERGRNPHLDPRELAWQRRSHDLRLYGDSHINAAFTYTRAGGNRFNTEARGAWYCAWNVMVSVSEVAWHRTRELGFTGCYDDSARYVELLADFIGVFDDMTDEPDHPALHADPEVGYPEGQSLAQHLRRRGSRGLIYPSVRAPGSDLAGDLGGDLGGGKNCLVCFDPRAIQNVRPGASWDLVWDGTPDYAINAVA
ncbi:RES family NAD+ phosphorylase [Marinovum sp. 2_MG-2023]|uniref:RES family NAD+ phosphorylase n=1 Tax=unclassified Marinovum TaxID=2647166 RepID=UPI0026E377B4|nr:MULTISPECIES: RES family NAD+ phosphorylase [unclassified Marinovum]MDO6730914.1 RES family NAD+ phosphorylase [Marinovum sp. 2_MG-2023]MDO6780141.1 RES family NAD+ phosphorylase [Marinovum sp. 1_MG-2023]